MNTSQKGTVGEAKTIYEISKLGLPIFREISNTSVADIITIVDNRCLKIQCKTVSVNKHDPNTFAIPLVSRTSGKAYTKDDFDILAVFVPDEDLLCYLNWNDIKNVQTITLRIRPGKVKSKTTRYANLYEDFLKTTYALEEQEL